MPAEPLERSYTPPTSCWTSSQVSEGTRPAAPSESSPAKSVPRRIRRLISEPKSEGGARHGHARLRLSRSRGRTGRGRARLSRWRSFRRVRSGGMVARLNGGKEGGKSDRAGRTDQKSEALWWFPPRLAQPPPPRAQHEHGPSATRQRHTFISHAPSHSTHHLFASSSSVPSSTTPYSDSSG